MTDPAEKGSLLDDLDARQDQVLEQLNELNQQIEALLTNCISVHEPSLEAEAAPVVTS